MPLNRYQFGLARLFFWTAILAMWLSLLVWAGPNWPYIVGLGLWIALPYIDRRFSPRFSTAGAIGIVVLILVLLFWLITPVMH